MTDTNYENTENQDTSNNTVTVGDSNEAKIRVAEYSTILFQQGQPRFVLNIKQLSNVFKSNRTGIELESNINPT